MCSKLYRKGIMPTDCRQLIVWNAEKALPFGPRCGVDCGTFPLRTTSNRLWRRIPVAALALTLGGCRESIDPGRATRALFVDATEEAGLRFVHANGMSGEKYFCEVVGAGLALLDYDRDGDLDAFFVQSGPLGAAPVGGERPVGRLLRNDSNLRGGRLHLSFHDVTAGSGLSQDGYGMGVAVGDYDRDGDPDLYVTGLGPDQLWQNRGDGTFAEMTGAAGVGDDNWSTSASFVDYDHDGWLDLFVANYVLYSVETDKPCFLNNGRREYCGPLSYPPAPDRLFRNRGDGTFEDASVAAGLSAADGSGLGVISLDADDDGHLDIYVANDLMPNQLWRGTHRGLEDTAALSGTALSGLGLLEASMGLLAEDFDGDGDEDIFIANLTGEKNTLYRNEGGLLFSDASIESGLGAPGVPYTGFGVAALDHDNDGWQDIAISNGEVREIEAQLLRNDPLPLKQHKLFFRNAGHGRFDDLTKAAGQPFREEEVGRGLVAADLDQDGRTDLLSTANGGPARLLRNVSEPAGRWIAVRVLGQDGGDSIGARVELRRTDGRLLRRRVRVDGSYLSSGDPRITLGLASHSPESLHVEWSDGVRRAFARPPAERILVIPR
jgi:hypothetical protein